MRTEERRDGEERVGDATDGVVQPSTEQSTTEPRETAGPREDDGEPTVELFAEEDVEKFRTGWQEVQTRFVDDPRAAVRDADHLVADVMRSLTDTVSDRKQELEGTWQQEGSTSDTEDLRQALRRYRSFLDRLLNA